MFGGPALAGPHKKKYVPNVKTKRLNWVKLPQHKVALRDGVVISNAGRSATRSGWTRTRSSLSRWCPLPTSRTSLLWPVATPATVRLALRLPSYLTCADEIQIVVGPADNARMARKASTSFLDPKKSYAVAIILGQLRVSS